MNAALATCLLLGLAASAQASPAPASTPRPAEGGVCVKGRALIAHAAYVPPAITPGKCAQLLSTGTIMMPRRWNKT